MIIKYINHDTFSHQAIPFFEDYYCHLCLGKYICGGTSPWESEEELNCLKMKTPFTKGIDARDLELELI